MPAASLIGSGPTKAAAANLYDMFLFRMRLLDPVASRQSDWKCSYQGRCGQPDRIYSYSMNQIFDTHPYHSHNFIRQVFSQDCSDFFLISSKRAEETCMATFNAGSDADRADEGKRISIAENDAVNDGYHPSGNATPRHSHCSLCRTILGLELVVTVIAAATAAVLILRHLVNI